MRVNLSSFLFLFLLSLAGCKQEPELRHYQEVVVEQMAPPSEPPAQLTLLWKTPDGWLEQPASEMRLATFKVESAECTIVAFPGDVGGVEANVKRWLTQLEVQMSDDQLQTFIQNAPALETEGGFKGSFFNFEPVATSTSMLATMISANGQTVFVKLMGEKNIVSKNREKFEALSRSLKNKQL